jgi:hypothetical protein
MLTLSPGFRVSLRGPGISLPRAPGLHGVNAARCQRFHAATFGGGSCTPRCSGLRGGLRGGGDRRFQGAKMRLALLQHGVTKLFQHSQKTPRNCVAADHRHRRLLRARREGPRHRAAEEGDELTPFQLIELHRSPPARHSSLVVVHWRGKLRDALLNSRDKLLPICIGEGRRLSCTPFPSAVPTRGRALVTTVSQGALAARALTRPSGMASSGLAGRDRRATRGLRSP